MKKLVLLFLLIFSFNIFSKEIKEPIPEQKPSKLFEGVDIDKILREVVEKIDKELGVDTYIEKINNLIKEIKEENSDPG